MACRGPREGGRQLGGSSARWSDHRMPGRLRSQKPPEVGNRRFSGRSRRFGSRCRRLMERMMAVDLSMPVLVVDDYNTMIRIICNLLKQLGYQNIDNATDGATALAKLRAGQFGLVISDWNMEQLHRQAVQRADPADQDRGRVCRWADPAAGGLSGRSIAAWLRFRTENRPPPPLSRGHAS
jgi:CheY-like chemotaxis protein